MSYWDTSCLIKLYTPELDSELFRARLAVEASCLTADIAPLEFWATVRRKETEGVLAPGEAQTVFDSLESDLAAGEITLVPGRPNYWCGRLHPGCVRVTGCLMEPEKPLGGIGCTRTCSARPPVQWNQRKPSLCLR